MNPDEIQMPGRPLTEEERKALQETGELPTSFDPTPANQEEPKQQQQGGFDLGQALQTGYNFLTENISGDPNQGQSLDQRQQRLRAQIEKDDQKDPVRQFTENLSTSIVDWVDNTFQGDQRTREEIEATRKGISLDSRSRMAAANEEALTGNDFTGETVRAAVGGLSQSLEGVLEAGDFIGDMGLTALAATGLDFGLVQDKDLTWHEDYIAMDYDFGVAPNNTRLGNFARNSIGVLINMRQLAMYGGGKVPILRAGMGPNSTWATRLGGDQMRGFLVDFFTNPGEGNLSNMFGGDQENAFILFKALAHEDEDNQYIRRLKNGIEGGLIGTAADGLGELFGALRKGYQARVRNKATPEKAVQVTLEEVRKRFEISERAAVIENKPSQAEIDDLYARYLEQNEFSKKDLDLPENEEIYPYQIESAKFKAQQLANQIPLQRFFDDGFPSMVKTGELPNGSTIKFKYQRTDLFDDGTIPAIEVSWDVKEGEMLGKGGISAIKMFNEQVQGLKPGTVLENTPLQDSRRIDSKAGDRRLTAADGKVQKRFAIETFDWWSKNFEEIYGQPAEFPMEFADGSVVKDLEDYWNNVLDADGRLNQMDNFRDTDVGDRVHEAIYNYYTPNTRGKIYQRVGFGEVDVMSGYQYGVVRAEPDAKGRWLEPLNLKSTRTTRVDQRALVEQVQARAIAFKGPNAGLYHGTTDKNAASIRQNGFRLTTRTERGGAGNALGDGVYFTSNKAYANDYGRNVLEGPMGEVNLKEITDLELEEIANKYGGMDEYSFLADDQALIKEFGGQYDGVRVVDANFGGLGDNVGDEIVIFDPKVADRLIRDSDPTTTDVKARKAENAINGSRPDKEGMFDPQERAQRTSRFDAEDVEVTQQTWTDPDGSTKPFLDNDLINRLDTVEKLNTFIKMHDRNIDIDEIAKRLQREPIEYQLDTFRTVARLAAGGVESKYLDELRFTTRPDGSVLPESYFRRGVNSGGAVVLKVMAYDSAVQMRDIARELVDLEAMDANFNTQALMILDRAELLMRTKKEATSLSSDLLQQWGLKPRKQFDEVRADDLLIEEKFAYWKNIFREGDVSQLRDVQEEFMDFATSLMLTDGDPLRQVSFWSAWAKQGFRNFNTVIINGMLSTPVSQMRNIAGNVATVIERPLAQAIGALIPSGELTAAQRGMMAKNSLLMFESIHETFLEAARVARKSWNQQVAVTDATKMDFGLEDAAKLEAVIAKAKTPFQRFMAHSLEAYHGFANSPWTTLPSRGLTSADDFFKTMAVRQELRYQAAMQAENFDLEFSPLKDRGQARKDIYRQLVDENLGVNGEIINQRLKDLADEVTFQTELEDGIVKSVSEFTSDVPALKQFMPFVKTPHNLNIYAGQHIPLPGVDRFIVESQKILKNGTPEQRAILRGKKALGFMMFTSGAALTHAGLLTGFGPSDPELRAIWLKTHQPQSIKIGGEWYSYKALPVVDLIFASIADTAMIIDSIGEVEADQLARQMIYTIASIAANRTYFSGLVELSGLLDFESFNFGRNAQEFVLDRANMAIGMSGLRGGLENLHKEGVTEYRTQLDAIMGRLSGGFMGERIEVPDILTGEQQIRGFEHPINFISPFRVMSPNAHPLTDFFAQPQIRFEMPRDITERVDGLELTPDESYFIRKEMYGNGMLADWLTDYVTSPRFKQDYINWQNNLGTENGVKRKESLWYKTMMQAFLKQQRKAVQALREDETSLGNHFRMRLEEHQLKQQPNATGQLRPNTESAIQRLSTFAN